MCFFLVFKAAPPTPPSPAQLQAQNEEHAESLTNFMQSIKRLCCNRSYMLLLVAYGINVGIFYAISTLLSQIIQKYYPVISVLFLHSLETCGCWSWGDPPRCKLYFCTWFARHDKFGSIHLTVDKYFLLSSKTGTCSVIGMNLRMWSYIYVYKQTIYFLFF